MIYENFLKDYFFIDKLEIHIDESIDLKKHYELSICYDLLYSKFFERKLFYVLKIAWSPLYKHPLPEGHRFPMEKYELIPEQLIYEGTIGEENLYLPGELELETILRTHDEQYWNKLINQKLSLREQRRTGFPLSPLLVKRAVTIPMGTIQNVLFAQQYGVSMNVAGGTHHAFKDRGEGFCLLNDIAIAVNELMYKGILSRPMIVDLDVHQGNGTAAIFALNPLVFTFSMHCEVNYPLKKEISDKDIALPAYTTDKTYLNYLKNTLPEIVNFHQPDFIFYLSGVDILETDKLGKLSISREGCKLRDEYVFSFCKQNQIPVTVCLGGGYSPLLKDIIEAHCNTFRIAQEIYF